MSSSRNLSEEDIKSIGEELAKSNDLVGVERIERIAAAGLIGFGWVAVVISMIWGDSAWLDTGLLAFVAGLWLRSATTNSRLKRVEFVLALHLHEGTKKVE